MMSTLSVENVLMFTLVLVRVSGIIFFLPIFGDSPTPVRVRILLSVAVAIGICGGMNIADSPETIGYSYTSIASYIILVFKELLIGAFIGYIAKLAFAGLIMAASIVGYPMGFGVSSILAPDASQQMDAFTTMNRIIMMMIFLGLGFHQIFMQALISTFELIPLGHAVFNTDIGTLFISVSSGVFVVAMQLSAPILISLLFTMAALGLMARTVPQMNVFTLSFPVSFFVGMFMYLATLPFYSGWIQNYFYEIEQDILQVIKSFM